MPTWQLLVREPIHIVYINTEMIETGLKSTERAGPWNDGIYYMRRVPM